MPGVRRPATQQLTLFGAWGADANSIWAVGRNGAILKWNGTAWNPLSIGATNTLNDLWRGEHEQHCSGPCGDAGSILNWDGSRWRGQHSGTENMLNGVWGADANNVWAVG